MTERIRWEDNEFPWDDNGCILGYVGDPNRPRSEWLFQIVQDNDDPDDEKLTLLVALHGTHRACDIGTGESPLELKAEAERWLSEFASSLGAHFPAAGEPALVHYHWPVKCGDQTPGITWTGNSDRVTCPACRATGPDPVTERAAELFAKSDDENWLGI